MPCDILRLTARMMWLAIVVAGAAHGVTTSTSQPAGAADPETLMKQLANDDWKLRQEAQERLVQIGDSIVPRLQQLLKDTTDMEVRQRVGATLASIDHQQRMGPSVITMHFKEAHPRDVFAELANQAHCKFPTWPNNLWENRTWSPISIDADHEPFWNVMRELCAKTGLQLSQMGMGRAPSLMQGGMNMAGPTCMSGAFMIVCRNINFSAYVDMARPNDISRNLNISFQAYPEPKLRLLQNGFRLKIDEAVDEKGNSLVGRDMGMSWSSGGYPCNLNASLKYTADGGKKIATIKGGTSVQIVTRSEKIQIDDILHAQPVERTVGSQRIRIEGAKKENNNYNVNVVLTRGSMPDDQWQGFCSSTLQMELLDAEGHALGQGGWSTASGTDRSMTYRITFRRDRGWAGRDEAAGEPQTLCWEVPLEFSPMELKFDFHDLTLPR